MGDNLQFGRNHGLIFAWGFTKDNFSLSTCLLDTCFQAQDWLGEGRLQIRGLHSIGARARAGESAVKCGVKSGKH
jgi:hypothetical protein